jgi:hypothetical protein
MASGMKYLIFYYENMNALELFYLEYDSYIKDI